MRRIVARNPLMHSGNLKSRDQFPAMLVSPCRHSTGHFRVPLASLSKRVFVNQTHFHMKGFARGLILKQRHQATRKCLIKSNRVSARSTFSTYPVMHPQFPRGDAPVRNHSSCIHQNKVQAKMADSVDDCLPSENSSFRNLHWNDIYSNDSNAVLLD